MLARASVVCLLLLALDALVAAIADTSAPWVTAWAAAEAWTPQTIAPQPPGAGGAVDRPSAAWLANQTLRQIVRPSVGGQQFRVSVSNVFGTSPLRIGAAGIAVRDRDATIKWGSYRALMFSRQTAVMIPAGRVALSDPVNLATAYPSDLAIDFFLPEGATSTVITTHPRALQTTYVSATGNHAGEIVFPFRSRSLSWFFLHRVDLIDPHVEGAIVVVGDSITEGVGSTENANRRWPDELARRLQSAAASRHLSVVNASIAGNQLLADGAPQNGVSVRERFERDVLDVPGIRCVIVMVGINDIGMRAAGQIEIQNILNGHQRLIARAHVRSRKIIGATLLPFGAAGMYTADREVARQTVNTWIRTGKAYDGVIDFDAVIRDPQNPTRLLPAYDSGDHVHPNDAGYKAMGAAVDLALFKN